MGGSSAARVLVFAELGPGQASLDKLGKRFEVVTLNAKSRDEYKQQASDGLFDGCEALLYSVSSRGQIGAFDAEIVAALPKSLRYVVSIAAGYDKIDWEACGKRNILVSHCVGAVDDATSTTAMYLLISALRNFSEAERSARAGTWKRELPMAHDPEGKTLGICGLGGIGKALARRALAFDMRIVYHNRHPVPAEELKRLFPGASIEYKSTLDELLESSDVVAIGVPSTPATFHLFSDAQFKKMRAGSVLVNIARGEIVDEAALLRALDSGHLYAAGLDVFEGEPSPSMKTLTHPRISVLPHAGTLTVETTRKMEEHAVRTIEIALDTGELRDVIPELKK